MSEFYPVPSRVSVGSPGPIPDLAAYREVSHDAIADPDDNDGKIMTMMIMMIQMSDVEFIRVKTC